MIPSMLAWTAHRYTTCCVMTKMATATGKVTVMATVVVAHYLMGSSHLTSMIGTVRKN